MKEPSFLAVLAILCWSGATRAQYPGRISSEDPSVVPEQQPDNPPFVDVAEPSIAPQQAAPPPAESETPIHAPPAEPESTDAEAPDEDDSDEPWTLQPPRLGGYIQAHYRHAFETGETPLVDNPNFRVQRVRLQVEGDLFEWLSYDVEFDPRAPEVLGILRDAFITLRVIPHHRLRIGQQKTQFGYENPESSSRLYAVNRSEMADALMRGINLRDIGIGLLGHVQLVDHWRIEEAITVVNGAGFNVQNDDTPMKDIWGRIGLRYRHRGQEITARLGISGGIGDHIDPGDDPSEIDDFRLRFRRVGTDFQIDHRWFFLSSEFAYGWDSTPTEDTDTYGFYANAVGKTPWEVGPIIRYDRVGDEFERWTFGAYYGLPDASLRVMLNYELRLVFSDLRGDDKLYAWVQVRF